MLVLLHVWLKFETAHSACVQPSDMNHMLHGCTHGSYCCASDDEAEVQKALEKVEDYVSRLVRLAAPRSMLFLAVDGVGPRAKMNQQRTRRFLAVHTRKLAVQFGMVPFACIWTFLGSDGNWSLACSSELPGALTHSI